MNMIYADINLVNYCIHINNLDYVWYFYDNNNNYYYYYYNIRSK